MKRENTQIVQNLHTHTSLCDGRDAPEELVRAAIAQGLDSLGFSGHSPMPGVEAKWACLDVPAYRAEVLRLREKYAGQLDVFLGMEQDVDSPPQQGPWDYVIGSVHGIRAGGGTVYVDGTAQEMERTVREHFGGEPCALAEAYFRRAAEIGTIPGCRIVGHFDLLTKFNERARLFDEEHPRYRRAALEALDALAQRDLIFEINTGAMARGFRTTPYPSAALLRALGERNGRICITSDCHDARLLRFGAPQAAQLAGACGFRESWVLTKEGFIPQGL